MGIIKLRGVALKKIFVLRGAFMSTKNDTSPFWAKILFAVIQGVINAIITIICLKIFGVI